MVHCVRGRNERDRYRRFRLRILAHNQNICFTTRSTTQVFNRIGILVDFKGISTRTTRDNIITYSTRNLIITSTSINRINALSTRNLIITTSRLNRIRTLSTRDLINTRSTSNLKSFLLSRYHYLRSVSVRLYLLNVR